MNSLMVTRLFLERLEKGISLLPFITKDWWPRQKESIKMNMKEPKEKYSFPQLFLLILWLQLRMLQFYSLLSKIMKKYWKELVNK